MQYIAIFDGTMPLHIYFKDEKKLFHAPVSQRVDVNQPLVNALEDVIGRRKYCCSKSEHFVHTIYQTADSKG